MDPGTLDLSYLTPGSSYRGFHDRTQLADHPRTTLRNGRFSWPRGQENKHLEPRAPFPCGGGEQRSTGQRAGTGMVVEVYPGVHTPGYHTSHVHQPPYHHHYTTTTSPRTRTKNKNQEQSTVTFIPENILK